MNDENEKELERRRLTDEVRQTVERELKKRYSWIGLILAVVMGSLITLLVRQSLSGAEVQLKVTEKLSERVNDQLVDLEQRAKSLGQHLADVTEQSLRFSDDLRTQINEQNNVVAGLNTSIIALQEKSSGVRSKDTFGGKIGKIGTALKRSEDDIKAAIEQTRKAKW